MTKEERRRLSRLDKLNRQKGDSMIMKGFKFVIGAFLAIMFIYFLTLVLISTAYAADFRIYPRMENTDGSTIARDELREFRLYCSFEGSQLPYIEVPAEPLEETGNVNSPYLRRFSYVFGDPGVYTCTATTVDIEGDESAQSSAVNYTEAVITIPLEPRLFLGTE